MNDDHQEPEPWFKSRWFLEGIVPLLITAAIIGGLILILIIIGP